MASISWPVLLFLVSAQLYTTSATTGGHDNLTAAFECLPDQAASLLRLKQSFSFEYATTTLLSWEGGTDCCRWEGVGCDTATGLVNALNLSNRGLYSYGIDQALFNLTSIKLLDLSMNDFGGSELPAAGFERLSSLAYLDLSSSGFSGQIPISIAKITSLVSLDLSNQYVYENDGIMRNHLLLWEPNFQTLVRNLSNMRELYLDGVNISSSAQEWSSALAEYIPRLRVLSLVNCGLQGSIDQSFSSLRSLEVINLRLNSMSGAFPQYFADFLNLSMLMLAGSDLDGLLPQKIFELKKLTYLELPDNLVVQIQSFPNGSSLQMLALDGTNLSIANSSSIGNLRSLQYLGIDAGVISKEFSSSLSTLDSLEVLDLSRFVLQNESFFSWIGDLKNLMCLFLSYGDFSRTTNSWIGNLTNLEELIILHSFFSGPIPTEIGNLKNLMVLTLDNCSLSGSIPVWIADLKQLSYMDLSYNNLSGEIPTQLFALPELRRLALKNNQLCGSIQDFDASSSGLAFLDLKANQLSGHIPRSFSQLQSLYILDLSMNNFSGLLELNTLRRLRKLSFLSLSNNKLSVVDGEVNNSLPSILPKIDSLYLSSCKLRKVPRSLMHLNHIQILDLSSNQIQGTIPEWLWKKWSHSLTYMNLSHNNFSSMELSSYFLPNMQLQTLDLSYNNLHGIIPIPGHPTYRQLLDYSNNIFSSTPENFSWYLSQTAYLSFARNNISGQLSDTICGARMLEVLDLSYNNFNGLIPPCLIEDGHLGILNLRENRFEGALSFVTKNRCNLQTIDLHGNKIEGPLPRLLSNCSELEVIDFGNNRIADTFPSWLGKLSNLRVIVLRSNQFYGAICDRLQEDRPEEFFTSLQIIDLASNNFSGFLCPKWFDGLTAMTTKQNTEKIVRGEHLSRGSYQNIVIITYKGMFMTFEKIWTTLMVIDFSNNYFHDRIPDKIGKLVSLHELNLSHNAFDGKIPQQIGGMTELESLDLSSNQLSGEIPQELTNLTFLGTLNLSNNKLVGRIPESHQFGTFPSSSFEGNAGLCGAPLPKQCKSSNAQSEPNGSNSSRQIDFILYLISGAGFGIGFAAAILIKWVHIGKWCKIVGILLWPIWPWARPAHGGQQELDQANPCANSGDGSCSQSSSSHTQGPRAVPALETVRLIDGLAVPLAIRL